jgi:hypothetical protein
MKNKVLAQRRIQKLESQVNKIKSFLNTRDIQSSQQALLELKETLNDLGDIIEREN